MKLFFEACFLKILFLISERLKFSFRLRQLLIVEPNFATISISHKWHKFFYNFTGKLRSISVEYNCFVKPTPVFLLLAEDCKIWRAVSATRLKLVKIPLILKEDFFFWDQWKIPCFLFASSALDSRLSKGFHCLRTGAALKNTKCLVSPSNCLPLARRFKKRGWENSRQLCKPSTSSRVCIMSRIVPTPLVLISGLTFSIA